MGKRIHWILLIIIAALGLGTMIYFGLQPRPETRIKLRQYTSPAEAAQVLASELRNEIRQNPLVFLGVEPDQPAHFAMIKEFLAQASEAGKGYEVIVLDRSLETQDFPDAVILSTRDEFNTLVSGTEKALSEGQRVAVIVPTVFASQAIPLNLVGNYEQSTKRSALSLSITDFPRTREGEFGMRYPCIVQGVDQSGLGPFGCMIVTISRANYRHKFQTGEQVGVLNQIGLKDFLFLYTAEK